MKLANINSKKPYYVTTELQEKLLLQKLSFQLFTPKFL